MNNIREIQRLNQRELDAAVVSYYPPDLPFPHTDLDQPISASWHNDWNDTAYVYIGGLPYELSEGDIVTIFSQYGEPVHINLVRDKDTGKSKGFAFLKYEDQRSTVLAVDNLGGANILGRTIRVDHCRYKPKEGDGTELIGKEPEKEEEHEERRSKRRKSRSVERSPTPELLPEEIELQKLIRDHDEDDPMKDWLVREKKKEVEEARKKRDLAVSKHRSRDKGKEKERHRSHRHRSRSRERKHRTESRERRHRSRSREHKERHRERKHRTDSKERTHRTDSRERRRRSRSREHKDRHRDSEAREKDRRDRGGNREERRRDGDDGERQDRSRPE
jgi:RNA-binding motif X-linked protein 2